MTPPQGCIKEILSISLKKISLHSVTPSSEQLKEISPQGRLVIKIETSLKKSNPKKVMSDTKECCVCYEATEHLTPCSHLVCESFFSRLNTCPMCRAPLGRPVEEEDSSDDDDDFNGAMAMAAREGLL